MRAARTPRPARGGFIPPQQPRGPGSNRSPDPVGHAALLVRDLGFTAALDIATVYAKNCPAGTYWPEVLRALEVARTKKVRIR